MCHLCNASRARITCKLGIIVSSNLTMVIPVMTGPKGDPIAKQLPSLLIGFFLFKCKTHVLQMVHKFSRHAISFSLICLNFLLFKDPFQYKMDNKVHRHIIKQCVRSSITINTFRTGVLWSVPDPFCKIFCF